MNMISLTRTMRVERRFLYNGLHTRRPPTPRLSCRCFSASSSAQSKFQSFPFNNTHVMPRFQVYNRHKARFLSVEPWGALDDMSADDLRQVISDSVQLGDAVQADQALLRLEKLAVKEDTEAYPDIDTYTAVLDAWIRRQIEVDEGPSQVNEMYQAADRAHTILDKLQRKSSSAHEQDSLYSSLRPTRHHYNAVLHAWLNVTRIMLDAETPLRGIPQRSQRILELMEAQAKAFPESNVEPSIDHYNAVLEAWGNSPEHLRGSMAQALFDRMTERPGLEPTNETYLIMIRGWCRSPQDRSAFHATGHLMKMHRLMAQGVEGIELTMEDYYTILEAWTRAGDKLAPQKAFWVIKLMQKAYLERWSELRPDEKCYRYVLLTYSQSNLPDLGEDVDELMKQMEDRQLTPDSTCYEAAIRTWKNTATHRLSETQHEDAKGAHRTLTHMEKAYHRSSTVLVQPKTEQYNDVIQAWSASDGMGAAERAEGLLEKLEEAYADGDENLKPDADSYRWVLEAFASSPNFDKVESAMAILKRMEKLSEESEDRPKPTVDVFNAFIHVCATTVKASTAREKEDNLKLAVDTVQEMRNRGEAPDSKSFTLLLEASRRLLPLGKRRSLAVLNIFKNCCHLGLVDDEVLAKFREVASHELYSNLVVAHSKEEDTDGSISGRMIPDSWTRNIGVKVLTVNGKAPKPLNIDAKYVATVRSKEKQTKRFRQHKNKHLFRGGRKKYVKNSQMTVELS